MLHVLDLIHLCIIINELRIFEINFQNIPKLFLNLSAANVIEHNRDGLIHV